MLGSFGAAGLSLERVGAGHRPHSERPSATAPYCVNLIHSPNEPAHEMAAAELLLAEGRAAGRGVARTSTSRRPIVRYRVAGLYRGAGRRSWSPATGSSPRCPGSRWRRSSCRPPPERIAARSWSRPGTSRRSRRELAARVPMARRRDRRGRQRRPHRQPPGDHAAADDPRAARPAAGAVPVRGAAAGRAGRRHRHPGGGGGGVRAWGRPTSSPGQRQPGVRRVGQLGRRCGRCSPRPGRPT